MRHLFRCLILWTSLTTAALPGAIFNENFAYPNGSLVSVAGGTWATHSGGAGQVNVVDGQVELSGAESEDVNAAMPGGPFTSGLFSVDFTLTMTALQTTSTYFIHFKDVGTQFRARVFATPVAGGMYQLAIANTSAIGGTPFQLDLAVGTAYAVNFTFDVGTGISTLSVNGGAPVTAADPVSAFTLVSLALRQSTGGGTMLIDNISVSIVPEPSVVTLALLGLGGVGFGALRRRRA